MEAESQKMSFRICRTIFFILMALQTVLSFDTFAAQTKKQPLSIVFTGGSSLGAYQAGFFYQINKNLKRSNSSLKIKSLSGSSAGAINAFLGVYDVCSNQETRPENSLSFNVWKQFTLANLYSSNKKQNSALLTKIYVSSLLQETKDLWSRGFSKDCDLILNFSATRVNSQIVKLNGLLLSRAEETFSIRVKGHGLGRPPELSNVLKITGSKHTNLLNFEKNNFERNFSVLSSLITASASFPYFFSPVTIEHCETTNGREFSYTNSCDSQGNLQKDDFFDGALFRSSPLIYILDSANQNREVSSSKLKHLIISSESRSSSDYFNYRKSSEAFLNQFLLNYGAAANDAALYERIKNSPSTKIIKSENLIPRVGESFLGFFGFLDPKFLEFDFILGMLEADFIRDTDLQPRNQSDHSNSQSSLSFKSELLQKKECLKNIFLNQKLSCKNIKDPQFLKLAELSLGFLLSECESLRSKFNTNQINPFCLRLSNLKLETSQKPKEKESKLKYSFRQLKNNGFQFQNFPELQPYQIPMNIRQKISAKANQIKRNKKSPYAADIKNFERLLLLSNFYPRKSHFNVLIGDTFEFAYNNNWNALNFLKSERLKFSLALQIDYIFDSSAESEGVTVSTLAGYEYLITNNSSLFEASLGLRAGAKFYTESKNSGADPVIQALGALSFFEKVRFQSVFEFNTSTKDNAVLLGLGFEY